MESLNTEQSLTDYTVYHLSFKEKAEYYFVTCMLCIGIGLLFYNNIFFGIALCAVTPLFKKRYSSYKCDKRRKELLEAFKDVLYCISASVAAGRQMPTAIEDAANQADLLKNPLAAELWHIVNVYKQSHGKIEDLLCDLSVRSGLEEIKLFSGSYRICKKSGGDLESVSLKTACQLIERIDYQNDVSAILSEKKLDTVLLMIMPPAILFFLNMSSYDYVAILYESSQGRVIMTVCLLLMAMAAFWSLKIMKLDL